jgi:uncharacterized phiE125 gp8 family phage protein
MPLIQTAAPGVEPLSLSDVKNALRVDDDITSDDALLTLLISAARRHGETLTGRSFITQSWRLVLDSFPGPSLMGVPFGQAYGIPGHAIVLEKGVVQSVTGITYQDMSAAWQTMDPTTYVLEPGDGLGRITPTFGKIWPINLPQIGSVRVDFTAGYGTAAANVPEGIRQWMLVRVITAYEHRDEMEQAKRGKLEPMPFVDGLLDPYRMPTL